MEKKKKIEKQKVSAKCLECLVEERGGGGGGGGGGSSSLEVDGRGGGQGACASA